MDCPGTHLYVPNIDSYLLEKPPASTYHGVGAALAFLPDVRGYGVLQVAVNQLTTRHCVYRTLSHLPT